MHIYIKEGGERLTEEEDKGDTEQDQNVRNVHNPGIFE